MNILVVGSGGREHALAWKFSESPNVDKVYCYPGNGGILGSDISSIELKNEETLADAAIHYNIDLTVIGPEKYLCDGIVDEFREKKLKIFGPDKKAAQLEGSKWFAKEFMNRYAIPTAKAEVFTDESSAIDYVKKHGTPVVVKADGLAAGKGVTVAFTNQEAIKAVRHCFSGAFGDAGYEVVIEDYLDGEEASILAFVDHDTIKPLASSQDHKRLNDNDKGPNTGGMGAYSPAPVVDDEMWRRIDESVLQPFLHGCQTEKLDYRGIIYAGIMITSTGPKVLEFNVRFGDPETQAVLYRLKSDLAQAMLMTIDNKLVEYEFEWEDQSAVCVVLVSGGYPGNYEKGHQIFGIEDAEQVGVKVFHAGTRQESEYLSNSGGRVLGVTAKGNSLKDAVDEVYKGVEKITWTGMYYRKDIATGAL